MNRDIVVSVIAASLFLVPSIAQTVDSVTAPAVGAQSPPQGTVSSPALEIKERGFRPDGSRHYLGEIKDAKPGSYRVNLRCEKDGRHADTAAVFRVLPKSAAAGA